MRIRKIRIGDALWTEMEDRSQKIGLSVSALVRMLVIQGMATPTPDPAPEVREGAGDELRGAEAGRKP